MSGMFGNVNTGDGHGHMDDTGKHQGSTPAAPSQQIGQAFTGMVATSPVMSLSVRHAVIGCDSCGAGTYHAPGHDLPSCAGCGSDLDPGNVRRHEVPTRKR